MLNGAYPGNVLRFVLHYHITSADVQQVIARTTALCAKLAAAHAQAAKQPAAASAAAPAGMTIASFFLLSVCIESSLSAGFCADPSKK